MSKNGSSKNPAVTLATIILFIASSLIAFSGTVHARSSYLSSFNNTYGTSATPLNSCSLCHPGGNTGSRNPYATAYSAAGHSFPAVEAADSDGDGFANRAEIDARTFPGDASSKPAVTPPPVPTPPPGSTPPPAPVDTTKPTVVSTIPVDGSLAIPVNGTLKVTFSEAVTQPAGAAFTVEAGNAPVAGTVTLSLSGTVATFQPSTPLAHATTYTATVTTGVTDLAGNALAQPQTWSFTTAAAAAGDTDGDGDGVPDNLDMFPQDNRRATVQHPVTGGNTTIDTTSTAGSHLMAANHMVDTDPSLNQAGKPDGYVFRHGVIAFQVAGIPQGGTANVVLTFPGAIPANARIYKVDSTGFHEFPHAVVAGNTVTLTLIDGGEGDADGLANGVIDDPVAVVVPPSSPAPGTAFDAAGGGGCSVVGNAGGVNGFGNALGFLALILPALLAGKGSSRKR